MHSQGNIGFGNSLEDFLIYKLQDQTSFFAYWILTRILEQTVRAINIIK